MPRHRRPIRTPRPRAQRPHARRTSAADQKQLEALEADWSAASTAVRERFAQIVDDWRADQADRFNPYMAG